MISALRCDLTLLENQIPFFVLEKLYDLIMLILNFHNNVKLYEPKLDLLKKLDGIFI